MNMYVVPTILGRIVLPEDEATFFQFLHWALNAGEVNLLDYPMKKRSHQNMVHINAETYMLRKGYEVVC